MTLQEAKDQIARNYKYEDWAHMMTEWHGSGSLHDEAAELYASNKWDEALDRVKKLNPYKTDPVWAIDEAEIDALKPEFINQNL